jgi:hypothetical protein
MPRTSSEKNQIPIYGGFEVAKDLQKMTRNLPSHWNIDSTGDQGDKIEEQVA